MAVPTPTSTPSPISPDSAVARAIRTFFQAFIGFVFGLLVVIWAVPGVPHAVIDYVSANWVQLALDLGIPSGVASFIWNLLRKDVPNL